MVGSGARTVAVLAEMAAKDLRKLRDAISWRGAPEASLASNGPQAAAKKLRDVLDTVLHPAELAEHRLPRLTALSDQKGIWSGQGQVCARRLQRIRLA